MSSSTVLALQENRLDLLCVIIILCYHIIIALLTKVATVSVFNIDI